MKCELNVIFDFVFRKIYLKRKWRILRETLDFRLVTAFFDLYNRTWKRYSDTNTERRCDRASQTKQTHIRRMQGIVIPVKTNILG